MTCQKIKYWGFVEVGAKPRQVLRAAKSRARTICCIPPAAVNKSESAEYPATVAGFHRKLNIGVSSSGKTQHFDCCIRRFESCHPSQKRREAPCTSVLFLRGEADVSPASGL